MLPAILDGLADESEGVRNAALAAGHTFVATYAQTSLPLLLPAVEAGIVNDNWRIRQSSVELLGDLLFKARLCPICKCPLFYFTFPSFSPFLFLFLRRTGPPDAFYWCIFFLDPHSCSHWLDLNGNKRIHRDSLAFPVLLVSNTCADTL